MANGLRIIACAAVSLMMLSAAAYAADDKKADPEYSATLKSCTDKAGDDHEMASCYGVESERQDKELNDLYRKIMTKWSGDKYKNKRTLLQNAERAWIANREASCNLDAAAEEGGTLELVIYASCFLDTTYKRVQFLKALSEDDTY